LLFITFKPKIATSSQPNHVAHTHTIKPPIYPTPPGAAGGGGGGGASLNITRVIMTFCTSPMCLARNTFFTVRTRGRGECAKRGQHAINGGPTKCWVYPGGCCQRSRKRHRSNACRKMVARNSKCQNPHGQLVTKTMSRSAQPNKRHNTRHQTKVIKLVTNT
jgi:hypothetical protein